MTRIDLSTPSPKARDSFDRTASLEQTRALIPYLRARFAIDRIADLTLLDRSRMPVVSAIVARSLDGISIYNGKGPTHQHAIVGAVMEAVERQAATRVNLPKMFTKPDGDDAFDARELGLLPEARQRALPFVEGYDILAERPRFVPLAAVQTPWRGMRTFAVTSTNGLAAGNSLAEATYHALFELVERHLFSLAQARGHAVPRLIIARMTGSHSGSWVRDMIDDRVGRSITRPTGDPTVDALCDRIEATGIEIRFVTYEEPPLPPLVVGTVAQRILGGCDRVHLGLGCSWSPRHAVLRALTEAMQSRVTDTSGGREDIVLADDPLHGDMTPGRRTKRLPTGRWYFDATRESVALCALVDQASDDVASDVCTLLSALRTAKIERIVVVDITPNECPIRIVRVVAPELESAFVDGRIGPTISKIFQTI